MTDLITPAGGRFLRMRDVCTKIGVSRSVIYDWVGRGEFPAPIKFGRKISVWSENEIDRFMAGLGHEQPPRAEAARRVAEAKTKRR